MRKLKRIPFFLWLLSLSWTLATPARAGGLEALEEFLRRCTSGRAEFTQTVTPPGREGSAPQQPVRSKTSSGQFSFQRPNRFRFHYEKPFEQTLVADGNTLWSYDPGLQQASGRRLKEALSGTALALLASAPDLRALQADYQLQAEPEQDGLQWVLARPRTNDSLLQTVRIGFLNNQLAALDVLDHLGQRSHIRFRHFQANPSLPASEFEFKPPAGVDVIRP